MRIGLAQMDIIWENVQKNKEKAEKFIKKAKEHQVELLAFPEMSLTGFSMNVEKTTENWQEQVQFFKKMSLKYEITLVFGYPAPVEQQELLRHPGWKKYQNWLAAAEKGEIRMSYAKIHPFTFGQEGDYFQGGEKIDTLPWKDTVLGGFVCYDLRFPEIFQISSADSEVILVIANWPDSRIDDWDCLLKVRAIENQAFVAGINRVGEGGGIAYNGHSALYGPRGERLTRFCEEESLLIGDIDPAEVRKCREVFPVKKDRREDVYWKESRRRGGISFIV
ncbi:2-oxoglutaramate amidase [Eubacteriaceae bacterium CHKCI004]|nr:2-oxoglutaramate amidase [Eubacteriaceae bacterium CHKCI004]